MSSPSFSCFSIVPLLFLGWICSVNAEQMGANGHRNQVLEAADLPASLSEDNLLWQMEIKCKHVYQQPVFVGDKLLIGADGKAWEPPADDLGSQSKSVMICLDKETGEKLWQLSVGTKGHWWTVHGNCSVPWVDEDGKRAWVVSAVGDLLCIDLAGQADGNDGPYQDEAELMGIRELTPKHGDILWRYPFAQIHKIQAHDAFSSDPLIIGDLVIFATGHAKGRLPTPAWTKPKDREKWKFEKKPNLIALNKNTGELVATDDVEIEQVFHGQWSSPSLVQFPDQPPLIVWGSGYGILYGFLLPEEGSQTFRKVWECDLNTAEQRAEPFPDHGTPSTEKNQGPLHVIARPVIYQNKIYVATGRDHYYTGRIAGGRIGTTGYLYCIDPWGQGDITETHVLWRKPLYASQCSVSITDDGLLFIASGAGFLHCFDAQTGQEYWVEDLGHDVTCRSQVVADGKIYVGDDKRGFHVYEAAKAPRRLFEGRIDGLPAPVSAEDGKLIIGTERTISAYGPEKTSPPPRPEPKL